MKIIPSILDLAKVPSDSRVITLPNGHQCTIGTYLEAWRKLKSLPPQKEVKGWEWFPTSAQSILRDMSRGVEDRINLRAGVRTQWRDNSRKWEAERRRRVQCFCKWCGQALKQYQPEHSRFCEPSCYRAYHG